jgi:hypothetical protein
MEQMPLVPPLRIDSTRLARKMLLARPSLAASASQLTKFDEV